MPFIVATIIMEGRSRPVNEWFGVSVENSYVTLSEFYDEFSDGKFDNEPVPDERRCSFIKVFAGKSFILLVEILHSIYPLLH